MYLDTRYFCLICGILVIILRLLKIIGDPFSLTYLTFLIINIILGLLGIYFFVFQYSTLSWLHDSLLNLLIGVIMIADGMLMKIME
jgi:hypothetical protein